MKSSDEESDVPLLSNQLTDCKHCSQLKASQSPSDIYQNDIGHSRTPSTFQRRHIFTIFTISCILCFATALVIAIVWIILRKPAIVIITEDSPFRYDQFYSIDSPKATGCGSSVQEAIALDCRFDELSDLWLPQKCSRKYEEEYLRSNDGEPFLYWEDPQGKNVIMNRSQYAGGATYYSTTRDHLRHCEYNFYRFADSLVTGDLVGHSDAFAPHLHHCAQILGHFANLAPNIDNIDVDTISTFGYC